MADFRQVEAPRPPSGSDQSPDLLAALGRQWLTILLAALIGALLGWGYAAAKQTTYQARSTLLLIPVGNESDPGGGRNRSLDVDTWATVARSTNLLQDVADRARPRARRRTRPHHCNRRADRRRTGADVRRQQQGCGDRGGDRLQRPVPRRPTQLGQRRDGEARDRAATARRRHDRPDRRPHSTDRRGGGQGPTSRRLGSPSCRPACSWRPRI